MLASDKVMLDNRNDWLVRETIGMLRRTLARLDVSSRSMYALIEPGSCFAGHACLNWCWRPTAATCCRWRKKKAMRPGLLLDDFNFGLLPAVNRSQPSRNALAPAKQQIARHHGSLGKPLNTAQALELGLVTFAPDDLDWQDEVRIAIEERVSLSPDALTGMEASLRFPDRKRMETKVFGRLSAWQNWVFIRPNSTGEHGALKLFGIGFKGEVYVGEGVRGRLLQLLALG